MVRGTSSFPRIAALIALGVAVVAIVVLLAGGGGGSYEVTGTFQNASQLVKGNQVVVGGTSVGSVKDIKLGDDGQALVTFSVSDDYAPLERGTTATIRSYSLSGIANRQVQLTLPAPGTGGAQIPDGGELSASETVSEVDLDQVFNTLDPATIKDFKHVIQGFAASYEGIGPQANKGFHYLNPFLSTSRRLFAELTYDQSAFEHLITDTSNLSGALAERAPDISALVHNLNLMMGALGRQKVALADSLAKLPDFMREANTTFVNLRSALDDLDPLVNASKPIAPKLAPFLAKLRGALNGAVPTVRDLDLIVKRGGPAHDLIELTRAQVPLAKAALGSGSPDCGNTADPDPSQGAGDDDFTQGSFGESVCALKNGLPNLAFFRPYTPELVGWFNDFSGGSGYIDAMGGIGRVATTFNTFSVSPPGGLGAGEVLDLTDQQDPNSFLTTDLDQRCPGALERPLDDPSVGQVDASDHSVPFTDGGNLTSNPNLDCDPSQFAPGP
jgi:phospholipid/cholesterol/gamma-HCH transport system substrate-binding protein